METSCLFPVIDTEWLEKRKRRIQGNQKSTQETILEVSTRVYRRIQQWVSIHINRPDKQISLPLILRYLHRSNRSPSRKKDKSKEESTNRTLRSTCQLSTVNVELTAATVTSR